MRSTRLLTSILALSSAASAWTPGWGAVGKVENGVVVAPMERRQQSKFDLSFTGVQGNTATTESSSEATATNGDDNNNDAESTNSADGTDDSSSRRTTSMTGSARRTGSSTAKTTTTKTFDALSGVGGITMKTPNAYTTQYYKIEDHVTFVWNYTNLLATPSKIDVLASCATNNQLYTISANVSWSQLQTIVWDTGAFQASATVPLLTETYTLIVYDAAKDVTAAPSPGYLSPQMAFKFGMYTPKPYTPLNEFKCVTCNSAMTLVEKQTLLALVAMGSLTAISFGWFTGVAGLW